jgi:hypothetical protein
MYGPRPIPFAERDNWLNTFNPDGQPSVWPKAGHYSLYGSSYVGFFASVARTTDDNILELDCLKTDFAHAPAFPTHLYFNPHSEERRIVVNVGTKPVDLYDTVRRDFVARGVRGKTPLTLAPDSASVIVRVPAGGKETREGGRLLVNGAVVDFGVPAGR